MAYSSRIRQELDSLGNNCGFLGDADPDGLISTFLAASYLQEMGSRLPPRARFLRSPLDRFDILIAQGMGFRDLAGFDLWQVYQSDEALKQLEASSIAKFVVFDHHPSPRNPKFETAKLKVLNPYLNSKRTSRCVTDLIFEAIREYARTERLRRFWRDLNAIGVVADHCVEGSRLAVIEVMLDYREHFQGVLDKVPNESALTSDALMQSNFRDAVEVLWAPYFMEGPGGVLETYTELLGNEPFDLRDILSEDSEHPALLRLKKLRREMNSRIMRMREATRHILEFPEGRIALFEVDGPYQESYTSNIMADANPDCTVIVKTRMDSVSPKTRELILSDSKRLNAKDREEFILRRLGTRMIKYSIRRRKEGVDLGHIVAELRVGGGHPEAAGAIVPEEAASEFESALVDRIRHGMGRVQEVKHEIH